MCQLFENGLRVSVLYNTSSIHHHHHHHHHSAACHRRGTVAVVTSRYAERSCARRFAVAKPRFSGRGSFSMVLSRDSLDCLRWPIQDPENCRFPLIATVALTAVLRIVTIITSVLHSAVWSEYADCRGAQLFFLLQSEIYKCFRCVMLEIRMVVHSGHLIHSHNRAERKWWPTKDITS